MRKLLAALLVTAAAPVMAETVNDLAPYDNQIEDDFWNTTTRSPVTVNTAAAAVDLQGPVAVAVETADEVEARGWTSSECVIDIETLKFGLLLFVR